jgi:hypothetical protein
LNAGSVKTKHEDREQAEPVGERSIKMHANIVNKSEHVGRRRVHARGRWRRARLPARRHLAMFKRDLGDRDRTRARPEVPVVAEVPVAGAYDGAYQAGVGESENVASGRVFPAAGGNGGG